MDHQGWLAGDGPKEDLITIAVKLCYRRHHHTVFMSGTRCWSTEQWWGSRLLWVVVACRFPIRSLVNLRVAGGLPLCSGFPIMIIGDNGSYFDSTQYSGIMATVVCFVQVCYTITCGISVMFEDECFKGSFSLDLDIDVEDEVHKDFLRANHIVRYHELSFKTWFYFSTVAARWDADLYIKVDDDV
ncbi:hypothetical protein E3N88_06209 [Mikania micrantha]|uniref:Uncharacterized protein n=1 Tax=Mikania micrantha TaxID=192012 RepID=A0A5N6PN52_9ASTR|nr:hypothetical protein E3N88_06209 [Mikania micrantha]